MTDETNAEQTEQTAEEKAYADAVASGDIIPEQMEVTANEPEEQIVEEPPASPKDIMIPKPRFDELAEENKALKERIAAFEAQKPQPEAPASVDTMDVLENRLITLQDKADELMLEGDLDNRKPIIKEIRELERYIAKTNAVAEVEAKLRNQQVTASMEQVIQSAYTEFPFLDNASPQYDADAVTLINAVQSSYMQQGYDAAQALAMAVKEKAPRFAPPSVQSGVQNEVKESREKAAKTKAASATLNQPASLPSKTDKNVFEVNVNTLTAAQIKGMSEEQKARLRGDI